MTTPAWGEPTGSMGFDAGTWREWYDKEFVPHLTADLEPTPQPDGADTPALSRP